MEMPADFDGLAEKWDKGLISARQAALLLGISHHTFIKNAKDYVNA